MWGDGHNKQPRSAGADSSGDEPVKSLRREGMDRARIASGLTALELDEFPMSCRAIVDSDNCEEADVEVDKKYVGVGYRANMVFMRIRLAQDVARERLLHTVECDWREGVNGILVACLSYRGYYKTEHLRF